MNQLPLNHRYQKIVSVEKGEMESGPSGQGGASTEATTCGAASKHGMPTEGGGAGPKTPQQDSERRQEATPGDINNSDEPPIPSFFSPFGQ